MLYFLIFIGYYESFMTLKHISVIGDKLSYRDDKKNSKRIEKYMDVHSELVILINHIQCRVIEEKPKNILDFICDELFSGQCSQ